MIDQATLKSLMEYDPLTGLWRWLSPPKKTYTIGWFGGHPQGRGHLKINVDGGFYFAHRLAWLYMTGSWPSGDIDHINCDKSDNRFDNLRIATKNNNQWNRRASSASTTGVKGVCFSKGKYQASIKVFGEQKYLGRYATLEEAAEAYQEAASLYHGEYARTI